MKRYSSISEDEQREIDSIVDKADDLMREGDTKPHHMAFGICYKCIHFCCIETEFDIVFAGCSCYDFTNEKGALRLSQRRKIVKCSHFSERGSMSLFDMKSMATLIDPPKRKAGFLSED